ncbi:MAG: hypothetical protein PVH68_14315 [Armatimonadota bacterium]
MEVATPTLRRRGGPHAGLMATPVTSEVSLLSVAIHFPWPVAPVGMPKTNAVLLGLKQ